MTERSTVELSGSTSRSPWGVGRWVKALLVAPVLVGLVLLGFKLFRLPSAGDRYTVSYESNCGFVTLSVDGLRLQGDQPNFDGSPISGEGTLVLTEVTAKYVSVGEQLRAAGILKLENGTDVFMEGGSEGTTFFTLECRI